MMQVEVQACYHQSYLDTTTFFGEQSEIIIPLKSQDPKEFVFSKAFST